ncbi:MAG TPA: glycosyltransferase [Bacteroidia bacterium]|jgi:sugar transferase (PEP-CTERM/EpsH1 system associated)|nr:glycosyltransferase [Bacteroidia bacterium]
MKLLYLTSRVPFPLDKGDKVRAYHQIEELSKYHEVCLFSLNDQDLHPKALESLRKICSRVEVVNLNKAELFLNLIRTFAGNKPMQVGYFHNARTQAAFLRLFNEFKPDYVFCQLIRTAEYARGLPSSKTLDYMDVFSKGIERRIKKVNFFQRPFFRMEYKRLLRYENEIFKEFDNRTIISKQDRDLIPHPDNLSIEVIPNGVDLGFFHAPEPGEQFRKEFEIIFNGNMSYPPNVESAVFLVDSIMPHVWKKYPKARVLISGTNPANRVRELSSERVRVSGWVEDVRTNFAKSQMLVAPMQSSIGLQNKLIEAMAMKLPCVTSTLANNALAAKDGVEVLVADEPAEYAEKIFLLIENKAFARQIAEKGYAFVKESYNWAKAGEQLNALIVQKK